MKLNQLLREDTRIEGAEGDATKYYLEVMNHLRKELNVPPTTTIDVHINHPAGHFGKGHNGSTLPDQKKEDVVHIYLRPGMDRATLLRALCHEAVHAEQLATGRLTIDVNTAQFTWEGKPVSNPGYNRNSEWELEAHIKEKQLLQSVIQAVGNLMT